MSLDRDCDDVVLLPKEGDASGVVSKPTAHTQATVVVADSPLHMLFKV